MSEIPHDKDVVFICRSGARSGQVCMFLGQHGYDNVINLRGGMIGWVGLLIPHIARMIVGPDNRILLPATALIGAIYLLLADNIARLLFSVEIPIGILTSLVGIPFFAFVLRRTKKGWN
jgi:ABC-type cobalamin transport system permease subunit